MNTEIAQIRNNRWGDFKERRLDAFKNFIAVIKKIKMIKNYIIHAKLRQLFRIFVASYNKEVLKKKRKMAMMFIAIKMFIKFKRETRKFAVDKWQDLGGYEMLMMKFKNTIRYSFMFTVIINNNAFKALKLDSEKTHRKLVNYGRDLHKQKMLSSAE